MPLISIIIPVYNKKRYINRCLDSILEQTYKSFEVILINDGSTDGSEKICDDYKEKDKRIKVIHIENAGVSNARNIGLDVAKGEYVQFVDSDDYLDPIMLESLIEVMEHYKSDIIISGIKKIDHNNKLLKEVIPRLYGLKNKKQMFEEFSDEQFSTGIYGCISNKLIRRQIIKEKKLKFNTNIKLAEDLDFYLELYKYIDKIYFYKKSFYYYIQNTENSSTTSCMVNDYFTQILISIKQKKLLSDLNALNNKNMVVIDRVITNFTLCYLYDKFSYNYIKFKNFLKELYNDNLIRESLVTKHQSKFNKVLVFFLQKKLNFIVWFILFQYYIVKKIYKKLNLLIQ